MFPFDDVIMEIDIEVQTNITIIWIINASGIIDKVKKTGVGDRYYHHKYGIIVLQVILIIYCVI